MKKLCSLLLVSTSIYLLSITQSPAQQNTNPFDDLFDNRRRGLFLGGTVSYGITQSGLSISADRLMKTISLTIQIAGVCRETFSGGLDTRFQNIWDSISHPRSYRCNQPSAGYFLANNIRILSTPSRSDTQEKLLLQELLPQILTHIFSQQETHRLTLGPLT